MRTAAKLTCILALFLTAAVQAEEKKTEFADLHFVVLKDPSGKPVRNASVILHSIEKDGRPSKGGLQVKTDPEGKASLSAPFGKMRVQVVAKGLQTFGGDFEVNQPRQEFTIRLKRPQEQFSIYK
jgi:hypothetical protein